MIGTCRIFFANQLQVKVTLKEMVASKKLTRSPPHKNVEKTYCASEIRITTWDGAFYPVNGGINYQPQMVQDFFHQQYHYSLDVSDMVPFPSQSSEFIQIGDTAGTRIPRKNRRGPG